MAPGREIGSALSGDSASDLVTQASSLLSVEAARLPSILLGMPNGASRTPGVGSSSDSFFGAGQPLGRGADPERLRRQAHEMLETLLMAFSPKGPAEDRVPLVRCVAAVAPGEDGRATLRVANDEATPSDVTIYCTNFVADSGYDIPSLRVTVSPRRVTIPAGGEATYEITIAIPQQTPAGVYSGLVQATGAHYAKAVVSVQVT